MKARDIINPTGTVIITFDNPSADQWEKGFAIILDGDLSMLDSLSFYKNDKKALDSALKSYYRNLDEVEFCTNDPVELKDWFPELKKITSTDFLSAKFDHELSDENSLQHCFDMLHLLIRKTGTW